MFLAVVVARHAVGARPRAAWAREPCDLEARLVAQVRAPSALRRALARVAGRMVATRGWERLGSARPSDYAAEHAGISARESRDLAAVDVARFSGSSERGHGSHRSAGSMDEVGTPYTHRAPEHMLLHRVVREQLVPFLARAHARERPAPHFVEQELRAFLRCEIPRPRLPAPALRRLRPRPPRTVLVQAARLLPFVRRAQDGRHRGAARRPRAAGRADPS